MILGVVINFSPLIRNLISRKYYQILRHISPQSQTLIQNMKVKKINLILSKERIKKGVLMKNQRKIRHTIL
jgi:hypothetical protein